MSNMNLYQKSRYNLFQMYRITFIRLRLLTVTERICGTDVLVDDGDNDNANANDNANDVGGEQQQAQ